MNEALHPTSTSDVPWSPSHLRVQEPDTSTLSGGEKPTLAAAGLLRNVAQGAHDTIDRLAKTDQLGETRDEWVEGMRNTVSSNPLASLAAAMVLGAVIARITR